MPEKANILSERHKFVIEKCNKELEIKKNINYITCKGSTRIENVEELKFGNVEELKFGNENSSSNQISLNNMTEGKSYEKKSIFLKELNIEKKIS